MHAMDVKMQKIETDPIFLWRSKVLEAVCKCDWHNVRPYLLAVFIFYYKKIQTRYAMTFTL